MYLIAVGGDGTVNEVLNGITDFQKVRLGVIASGSGNDFGKGMGIPTDPIVCMRQILKCIRREIMNSDKENRSWTGDLGEWKEAPDLWNQCRRRPRCNCL